jgi:hypothetical protein
LAKCARKNEEKLIFVRIEKVMQFKFLNKTFKPKQFDYSPMYYDERKERLELKKAQFERLSDEELSDEERRNMLRQSMHETWDRSKHAQQQRYSSNMRTIILLVVIVVLGYFIFNGLDDVDTVVKKLV